jgi:hypothetical protein
MEPGPLPPNVTSTSELESASSASRAISAGSSGTTLEATSSANGALASRYHERSTELDSGVPPSLIMAEGALVLSPESSEPTLRAVTLTRRLTLTRSTPTLASATRSRRVSTLPPGSRSSPLLAW